MKNILVPTDFSPASHNAAQYAVSLALSFDATIHLINVIAPPVIMDDSILAFAMVTQAELVDANKHLMEKEIEALLRNNNARIKSVVVEGFPVNKITDLAMETGADVIVMGMKGKGKSNSVFGSTTHDMIQRSTYPIFVIPEEAAFKTINNITFASDFDTGIEMDRYTVLLSLATKFNSQINILNVQRHASSMKQDDVIGKMQTSVAFSKHKHAFHFINERRVEEGINNFIENNLTDILAMVAHKHSLFERLFGKVHTKSMSYQSRIPLLVLQNK